MSPKKSLHAFAKLEEKPEGNPYVMTTDPRLGQSRATVYSRLALRGNGGGAEPGLRRDIACLDSTYEPAPMAGPCGSEAKGLEPPDRCLHIRGAVIINDIHAG